MGHIVSKRKLNAAVHSMHQFCPVISSIYPEPPEDKIVEAATVFIYQRVAHDVFGRRFAQCLRERLQTRYRHCMAAEVELLTTRISDRLAALGETSGDEALCSRSRDKRRQAQFVEHIQRTIRALLGEAGFRFDDPQMLSVTYQRFEEAVRRVKEHLSGIRRQNRYVMK